MNNSFSFKGVQNNSFNQTNQLTKPGLNKNNLLSSKQDNSKHVKFQIQNKKNEQTVLPTKKPNYHFTYGYNQQQQNIKSSQNNQIKSHIQIKNSQQKQNNQLPFSFERKNIFDKSKYQNYNYQDKYQLSTSQRKKKLKIFPENYKKNQVDKDRIKQSKEISQLKVQIESLRKELRLQTQKRVQFEVKHSTSIMNQSSIQRIQAERTRRLSQLNNFNETLYNQLAWKLKQLSNAQYEIYLEQSDLNKKFMESVMEHSSAKRTQSIYNPDTINNSKVNEDFIDIKQFQKKYEQQLNQSQYDKLRTFNSSDRNPDENINQTFNNRQEEVYSPFLLKQNKNQFMHSTGQDVFYYSQPKNLQKPQAFTFNKPRQDKQNHYSKRFSVNKPKQLIIDNENKEGKNISILEQKQYNQQQILNKKDARDTKRKYTMDKKYKNIKNINDLNQQIEDKIFKKRVHSQFSNNQLFGQSRFT